MGLGALALGLILAPFVQYWWDENVGYTPQRLSKLLKDEKLDEFTEVRERINYQVEFDGIDLSNRNLSSAVLKSTTLNHVNFSKSILTNSNMENMKVFGGFIWR